MSRVLAGSSKSSATEVSGAPFARARWFNFFLGFSGILPV